MSSLFGFGKKKATAPPPPPSQPPPRSVAGAQSAPRSENAMTITKIRDMLESLDKREAHLMRKMDEQTKEALKLSKANKKSAALICLKRKKMYEKECEKIGGQKITLETQRLTIETTSIDIEVMAAQRAGVSTLAANTKALGGIDAVEETMDQVEEGLQDAAEIGEAMSRGISGGVDDEDDLLAELEGLEQEELDVHLTQVDEIARGVEEVHLPSALDLPVAPKSKVKAQLTDEERELAELEASMMG